MNCSQEGKCRGRGGHFCPCDLLQEFKSICQIHATSHGDEILSLRQSFSLMHIMVFVPGTCNCDMSPGFDDLRRGVAETCFKDAFFLWSPFSARRILSRELTFHCLNWIDPPLVPAESLWNKRKSRFARRNSSCGKRPLDTRGNSSQGLVLIDWLVLISDYTWEEEEVSWGIDENEMMLSDWLS